MRAGIVVTGTEVLTGRVTDRNGPWLAERLLELGLDVAPLVVVGDRPEEMRAALDFLASQPDVAVIVTSGGLGPTDDDLTTSVVAEFQGREMVLDEGLEERITAIVEPLMKRWRGVDPEATRRATRKQAHVPSGAAVLEPVGTAPGVVVPPSESEPTHPTVLVLPGPPGELQPMWSAAVSEPLLLEAISGRHELSQEMLRLFGVPESEIVTTLETAREQGVPLDDLEVTTCLRGGELEIVTRFDPEQAEGYSRLVEVVRERHAETLFSEDGTSVDEQVADLLRESDRSVAVCESCTGGLLAGRLTRLAGSSEYVLGGVTVYSNELKEQLAGVPPELIRDHGAVSVEVAEALAWGAVALGAEVGVGVTGIAGPGGGTEEKPVGTVCFAVVVEGAPEPLSLRMRLPGTRDDVRDRSTTVALHMVRRALLGETTLPLR